MTADLKSTMIWLHDACRVPWVMGVLNVTPDSFSDGGSYASPQAAIDHARRMVENGARVIDIGGESTRPGAGRISAAEQIERVVPVVRGLAGKTPAVISIDTTRAEVARAAIGYGAGLINDISAGRDDRAMLPLAAATGVPIILMHMLGEPATMQAAPAYGDVVAEVGAFLRERLAAALAAGVPKANILLDPGIGFGKTAEHNLLLLQRTADLVALGQPLVVGTSRKAFLGRITGEDRPEERVIETAASVAWSLANGAAMVRVHDVKAMVRVARVIQAIKTAQITQKS